LADDPVVWGSCTFALSILLRAQSEPNVTTTIDDPADPLWRRVPGVFGGATASVQGATKKDFLNRRVAQLIGDCASNPVTSPLYLPPQKIFFLEGWI
jgi:hypothetical protein